MSRWRPALRIARRSVLRSPARSLLIALLIALPVTAATYLDVIARTFASHERVAQQIVGAADAAITVTPAKRLPAYNPRADTSTSCTGVARGCRSYIHQPTVRSERDPAKVDVAALLPAGSRLVAMPYYQPVTLRRGEQTVRTQLHVGDVREPLHRFAVRLEDGSRAPRAGDVLVTRKLGERLKLIGADDRLRPDATIALADGPTAHVAGFVRDPWCLSCEEVVAPARAAIARSNASGSRAYGGDRGPGGSDPTYLVDLPAGVSEAALGRDLAARGVALTTREALAHPERYPSNANSTIDAADVRAAALAAVIVGLGLLQIVLLAGTAFAVGTRRQVRELGLVAAGGGSRRDIRRIVLAQGLVLGALGAAIGVATGFAIAIGGRPLWERLTDTEISGWGFATAEIAGAALIGMLSGLAAAIIPAIGAGRMRPVNALAGRFRASPGAGRRRTWIGAGLIVIGAACGLCADRLLADDFAAYERALADVARSGRYLGPPSGGPVGLIIGGAALAVVGLVLLAPGLIGWIARVGARLPLSARLAVRDAERHRHRTGPATSAIVVAVTVSVALAFMLAGQNRAQELSRVPLLPPNMLAVDGLDSSTTNVSRAVQAAAAELPHARQHALALARAPRSAGDETGPGDPPGFARRLELKSRPGVCEAGCRAADFGAPGTVAVEGDDAVNGLIAGRGFDAPARRALAGGRVLVFDETLIDGAGFVRVAHAHHTVRLPGHLVQRSRAYRLLPSALVSERTARAQGWDVERSLVVFSYGADASHDEIDAALTAADEAGAFALDDSRRVEIENDLRSVVMLLVAAAAAFVTLMAVAISVALSAAEGRADLATLAAVGAPPRRRRALMAWQALFVGGLGCVLGVGLGTFVAFTARAATGSPEFVVPWANLAVTAIAVPLLAALIAALCTRSRLPLVRRAE